MREQSVNIVKAEPRHAYSLKVLTKEFFPYAGVTSEHVNARLQSKEIEYYVALDNGSVVGFVDFEVKENKAKVMGLAVLEEHRCKGIGRTLLERALFEVKARGVQECVVLVAEDNAIAISLYSSFGFAKSGVLNRKLWDKTVLLMSKEL